MPDSATSAIVIISQRLFFRNNVTMLQIIAFLLQIVTNAYNDCIYLFQKGS